MVLLFVIQKDIKDKLKTLEELHRKVNKYTEYRIEYVRKVNKEINDLRDTISKLMANCVKTASLTDQGTKRLSTNIINSNGNMIISAEGTKV